MINIKIFLQATQDVTDEFQVFVTATYFVQPCHPFHRKWNKSDTVSQKGKLGKEGTIPQHCHGFFIPQIPN